MPALPLRHRRSAVLILALLLMGAIVGSTISLSTIIVDSGRQTQTINDFIAASLAADSGLERGLAVVKAGRRDGTLPDTLNTIGTTAAPFNPLGSNFKTTSESPTAPDRITRQQLRPGEVVSFDILNTDGSGELTPLISGMEKIIVNGSVTLNQSAILDISWIGLNTNGEPYYSGRFFQGVDGLDHEVDLFATSNLRDINGNEISSGSVALSQTRGFRVRITAARQVNNGTGNTVYGFSVSGSAGFPSRINITSTGKVSNSQSQKTAAVLWQLPSSPVFNYVLFTEGGIIPLE
ncbi:MAG: hypothetical protein AAB619_03940 [Patescibacteria group bacterium]